ncbi:MAG: hypothetical protein JXA51_07745 [Dehalococcoidales bacterium]|nr:hypothetical protein [Dehalococcoidales bacterium]
MPVAEPEPQPALEGDKGRVMLNKLNLHSDKIIVIKIVDDFLVGVGTTAPVGCISSDFLHELRYNGVNYFLPFTSWGMIERKPGEYKAQPCPGVECIAWLGESGAVLNGHCFVFLLDEWWSVPTFAHDCPFEEQKEMLENFIRNTVARFPEIRIWTLNEPVAQNCLGWSREQIYDVFIAASGWVHEVNPQAKVMVNLIPIECNWGGLDYVPSQVADDLFESGLEADIIGIELYYWWAPDEQRDENGYPSLDWVRSIVDIFRKHDLPIIFSEVGAPGIMEERDQYEQQADWMEAFFRFCHDDEDIIGATWYFTIDDTFMPYAGLANDNYTLRPCGERLLEIAETFNPSQEYTLEEKEYLDLEPGEYDLIINAELPQIREIYRVNVVRGESVSPY